MFHLGSFESSLRSSDGGKKYAARKRKDKIALSEVQTKHKSCTGKAHGHGVLKNKGKDAEVCCQGKKKRKGEDQCVPKSNESLADSSTGDLVDQKVPGSSQEASVDGSIESDNEKLKSKVCDNCLSTRKTLSDCDRGDNGITSAADVFERWANRIARSRSCESVVCDNREENMDRKALKIRGPFGSLVDLSNPSDRTPFTNQNRAASPIKSVIVKELPGVEKISIKKSDVTKAKDNQSEDRLFEAIETLSKRKGGDEDKESPDVFEDLDVEEFESERVSKLFEVYFKGVQTKERNETEANIESLLDSLHNLEPSKSGSKLNRNRLRSSLKEKKKNGEVLPERGRLCKTHPKDEDIIKNILPDKKEFLLLNKAKKNAELERKWIPGGILKRSAPASDTVESIRIGGAKSPSNQPQTLSISKNDFLTQKLPVESTVSIKLKISGKSEKPDEKKKNAEKPKKAKKNSEDEFLGNMNGLITDLKKGTLSASENLQTEKDPKLTKQKFSEIMAENAKRKPSKNEILAKSNEVARKLHSTASGPSFSPRSSMRRKERINKILEMESSLKDRQKKIPNGVNSEQLNSSLDEDSIDGSKESLKVVKTNISMNGKLEVNGDPVGKKINPRLGRPLSEPPTLLERISNLKPMMSKRNSPQDETTEVLSSRSLRSGKVKKLISNFEMNSHCREDDSEEVKSKPRNQTASLGPNKKWEDFKKAKTEEDLANEKAWLDTEKLWLVHRAGFTAVRALPNSSNQPSDVGKVKVKVESTNEVLEVDDDDLEKANPSQLDKIEDICQLRYINESSVLYVLRQRFGNNLIHTYAAGNLIVINPQSTLFIYNEKVAALFRGCKSEDMPPHIYAMAQTAYRSMLSTRKDQSIVLLGRSGSGKTHNFRHILSYLLHSAGSVNKVLDVEKLTALNTVLEAFGNARTCLNPNATRCTNLISLDFDQTGQISSLLVQILMLEKQRVARRPDGEGTFNVFHWVLAGAEGSLAKQLFLDSTTQNTNLFMNAICKNEDRQRAVMEFSKLGLALKILGVSDKECFALWSVIAAIYHLGNAGTVRVGTNKWQFADPVHSSRACRLLGTTTEELCQALWNNASSPSRTPSPTDKDKTVTGVEALEGFVIGLYSELVNVINTLLNRSLTTGAHSSMSLVVVDSPGLQNPGTCGQQRGATFSDLCHNYVQERLHLLFHNVNLVAPHDRYTQEHIDVNTEEIYAELNSPSQLVSILDKSPPSGVLKTSQTDLREIDRRGLLWLLEEESLYPNSNDETFLERLFQHYGGKDHQMFIKKSGGAGHFVIQHLQGTSPVIYSAHGLLKASKENPVTRSAITFLQESTKEDISELFVKGKGGLLAGGGEGSQSLRRVSSIRRTCSVAVKRKSISLQVKFTADSLIETLRRTRPRFVFCMLPHHNAGNTEIIPAGPATGEDVLNVPLLRSQIRGAEILPAVRMFKQGFPEYFPYGEFRRRFRLLAPGCGSVPTEQTNSSGVQITINGQPPATEALDEARAVEEMLLHMDVDVTSYRLGLSQIFFRAGVLAQLESQRDEKLADLVIQLQSRCRGYLARKKLAKLKVQDLAVRCIQRNVRKLMQVREWPWWRLYVKVTPLLNVHRTEEELTAKIQELENLKSVVEKLEGERNQLKLENDKLETKSHEAKEISLQEFRRKRKMERNLGFFEAWRARRREKKDEEVSVVKDRVATTVAAAATATTTRKVENGMFSRFWRMGNQEVCAGIDESSKNEEKKEKEVEVAEVGSLVEANKTTESPKVEEIARDGPTVEKVSESQKKTESSNTKLTETGNPEGLVEGSLKQNGEVGCPLQVVTKISGPKGRRPSVDIKSPTDSRRSSISMTSFDSNSRRGSVVSPLGSFSNIQERIQALCQEQTQSDQSPKKAIKVRKLSQEALKICESSSKNSKTVEPVKPSPKINSNLQSKIMKFGAASSATVVKKATETNVGQKDDTNLKESTTKVSSSVEKTFEKKSVSENHSEVECQGLKPGDESKDTNNKSLKSEASKERQVLPEGLITQEKESKASVNSSETSPTGKNSEEPSKPTITSVDIKEPDRKDAEKASETKELGSNKCEVRPSVSKLKKEEKPSTKVSKPNSGSVEMKNKKSEEDAKAKKLGPRPSKKEVLQKEVVKEAKRVHENLTMLTNQMMDEVQKTENHSKGDVLGGEDKSETSEVSQSGSESLGLRKDSKKVMKKLKGKSNPNECYPKSQKMLASKPINAYEQANLEESKREAVVSPTKVEAFLRDTLSPPLVQRTKEPVKTIEAVVEEILTSKSEKSKHEKPVSQVKYSSKGEVITGVVSIKPSNNTLEEPETLSAITLVPAFRPENSILNKDVGEKDGQEKTVDDLVSVSAVGENDRRFEPEEKSLREEPERDSSKRGGSPFSSASDFSDDSYDHYIASVDYSMDTSSYDRYSSRRSLRSCSTPRRIFPQIAKPSSYRPDRTKEDSPVVIDASLSFDLSLNRTSVRHRFKPQPAFTERKTNSNSLSLRIAEFLNRTDHIMEEWKHLGKGGDDLQSLVQLPAKNIPGEPNSKSKSATNIMIKGLLNYSKGSSLKSRTWTKTSENYSDRTISDIDELSEMTMDLSEERANGTMQSERLEAETAERVRLEQELSHVQNEKKNLQQTSERLEMELFYARADVNGLSESEGDLEDGGGDAALYKNKCERAMRELEFTRRRLQQQHEDDLEQLVGLKKQLEKKLTDAYEEVEEQRQVAAQWKRKVQKLQSEMNDLRLLLEEQSSRNNLLEKKQRKFDSEIQMLQEELRSERNQKDRLSREKEMAFAEKYSMEQNLSSVRLELELKEEKVSALTREVEELTRGGGSEQEVTQLRKAKHDLEMKLKEQEEELDELAGQVSMLEGNKLRLEMSLESLRKEHRREMAQRDDELDEARSNAQKKVKMLESQLESEHEERTLLVREKHELERRLADAEERGRHYRAADEDALQRARRDLKKTKALLRDAQVMLERAKQDSPSKAALRALKNQLEDAELARASAVKARQTLESELNEISGQLEEALRAKGDAENRCQAALRETNALRTQVDENEEELAEVLKKYRQVVQQLSAEQLANQETAGALAEVEAERNSLKEQLAELTAKLEANAVVDPIGGLTQKKLEIRIKELESRLELEQTTRGRLEVQITRLKENVERLNEECVQARTKEQTATDLTRKLQRSLREAKEELAMHQAKEQEGVHKRKELEKRLETAEQEASTARTDLRLAVKRIEDLQSAISGEIGSDSERSESDEDDSGEDSLVSHLPSTLSSRTSRTPELTPR